MVSPSAFSHRPSAGGCHTESKRTSPSDEPTRPLPLRLSRDAVVAGGPSVAPRNASTHGRALQRTRSPLSAANCDPSPAICASLPKLNPRIPRSLPGAFALPSAPFIKPLPSLLARLFCGTGVSLPPVARAAAILRNEEPKERASLRLRIEGGSVCELKQIAFLATPFKKNAPSPPQSPTVTGTSAGPARSA